MDNLDQRKLLIAKRILFAISTMGAIAIDHSGTMNIALLLTGLGFCGTSIVLVNEVALDLFSNSKSVFTEEEEGIVASYIKDDDVEQLENELTNLENK
jgi:hypothetical protein